MVVVAAFGDVKVADCIAPNFAPGCIVARRRFAFADYTAATLPIVLDPVCSGVPCNESSTCVGKKCVDARLRRALRCERPRRLRRIPPVQQEARLRRVQAGRRLSGLRSALPRGQVRRLPSRNVRLSGQRARLLDLGQRVSRRVGRRRRPTGTTCDKASGACVGCSVDSDCTWGVCAPATRKCVACTTDATCSGARPRCRVLTGTCEACTSNDDCGHALPVCDPTTFTCRPGCTGDAQCPGKQCDAATAKCVDLPVDAGISDAASGG